MMLIGFLSTFWFCGSGALPWFCGSDGALPSMILGSAVWAFGKIPPWQPNWTLGHTAAIPLADLFPSITINSLGLLVFAVLVLAVLYTIIDRARRQWVDGVTEQIVARFNRPKEGTMLVENEPLIVAAATKCVQQEELQMRLEGYASCEDLQQAERRIESQVTQRFNELDERRRVDIKALHEKIEGKSDTLRAEVADNAREMRDRIDALPERLAKFFRGGRA